MPNLLGEAVEQMLSTFPGLRVVGRPPLAGGPLAAARKSGADVLLVYESDPILQPLTQFLDLSFFVLGSNGREGTLTSVRQRSLALEESGLAELRELVARGREAG